MSETQYHHFAGLDVSRDTIELHLLPEGCRVEVGNDERGYRTLIELLPSREDTLAVLESTGGFEQGAAKALARQAIDTTIVNPMKIFHFAKALGIHAKTDRQDAYVIARFAQATRPEPNVLLREEQDALRELGRRREQLKKMLIAEKNRKRKAFTPWARESVQRLIDVLEKELEAIEQQIRERVDADPDWKRKETLLTSMPGVGETTAHLLIALLPELGTTDRHRIAALVGVAPYNRDSGRKIGKRSIKGGRHHVRSTLYMATLVATRHNPAVKAIYERLLNQGKKKKIALVACMRHLIIWLNKMLADDIPWEQMDVCAAATET